MACLVPAIPWEIFAIFPINDRMEELGKGFDDPKSGDDGTGNNEEVNRLLVKWQGRHFWRIVAPAGAFLATLWSIVDEQKF